MRKLYVGICQRCLNLRNTDFTSRISYQHRNSYKVGVALSVVIFFLFYTSSPSVQEEEELICPGYNGNPKVYRECAAFSDKLKEDIIRASQKTWKSDNKQNGRHSNFLTLFTSFDVNMEKSIVFTNMLDNWKSLGPHVNTILFTDDNRTKEMATQHGWPAVSIPNQRCGSPVLKDMYQTAMKMYNSSLYGYANADILFDNGLMKTLTEIVKSDMSDKGPLLIVGRRSDLNMSLMGEPKITSLKMVEKLGKYTTLGHSMAGDIFVSNTLFLWDHVPEFAIGRPIIDNWLIYFARAIGSKVVDISFSTLAIHQKTSSWVKRHLPCNKEISKQHYFHPPTPIFRGSIDCAEYLTQFNSIGKLRIVRKNLLFPHCYY